MIYCYILYRLDVYRDADVHVGFYVNSFSLFACCDVAAIAT